MATVGRLQARPGAPNVVPGAAVASLDVRHADDAVRERGGGGPARARRSGSAPRAASRSRGASCMSAPAVAMDAALGGLLAEAVADAGLPVVRLASGAGHDAVALAR